MTRMADAPPPFPPNLSEFGERVGLPHDMPEEMKNVAYLLVDWRKRWWFRLTHPVLAVRWQRIMRFYQIRYCFGSVYCGPKPGTNSGGPR